MAIDFTLSEEQEQLQHSLHLGIAATELAEALIARKDR